jgi:hypothetical protein
MNRSGRRSRFRNLALAFAALLHLLAIPGEAMLHGWLHPDPHAPGWSAERHAPGTAHHHDLDCVVCQVAHSRGLPETGAAPVPVDRTRVLASAEVVSPPALLARTRVQARAPPVSIA